MKVNANKNIKGLLDNASWNILTLVITSLGAFFSMPIIINGIGASNYGLFSIIIMIGGFAALQGFGLGEATLRYVSFYHSKSDLKGVNRVVGATLAVYFITITTVFLVIQIFAGDIIDLFKLEPTQVETGIVALRLAGVSFVLITLVQALQKIPEALMRYDITSKANLIFTIIRFSSMVIVVKLGLGIIGLVWVLVGIGQIRLIVFFYLSSRIIPGIRIFPNFNRKGISEVFSFSLFSFLNQLISQFAHYADRIALGIFFGTLDVAFLSAPKDISTRVSGVTGAAGQALFPKFSSMDEDANMEKLYGLSLWTLTTFSMVLLIPLAIIFPDFITVWISQEFSKNSSGFARLFALGFAFNGGSTVYFSLLKGTGRIKWITNIMMTLTIFSTMITVILVYKFGILGSGIRTILFSWISIVICIVVGKKVFSDLKLRGLILEFAVIPSLVGVSIFFVGLYILRYYVLTTWMDIIIVYGGFFSLVLSISFLLNFIVFGKDGNGYFVVATLKGRLLR